MKKLVNIALVLAWATGRPAAAQTARIAHLSHSGSVATLDAATDNFGIPPSYFEADSIEILTDSTAREYGRWTGYHKAEKTNVVQFGHAGYGYGKSVRQYIASQQQYRPHIKVIRRDSVGAMKAPEPALPLKKQKSKRKKAAFIPTVAAPPQHPGVALAIAAILVMAGTGWLLGERPRPAAGSAA